MDETDEQLVGRMQQGEVLVFEVLVKKYQQKIIHFANRFVWDERAAEEIAQDTFVKTYFSIDGVDVKRKFSTYLFEIAKNTAISYLRKKRPEEQLDERMGYEGETMEDRIEKIEDRRVVEEALAKLPSKYRNIIRLYYFNDLSYEEIGEKMELPINTVRTQLGRGKKKLREILERTHAGN